MPELTKFEEQILLSVWNLQEMAYGISIFEHIQIDVRIAAVSGKHNAK